MSVSPVSMSVTEIAHWPWAYGGLFITSNADGSRPGTDATGAGVPVGDAEADVLGGAEPIAEVERGASGTSPGGGTSRRGGTSVVAAARAGGGAEERPGEEGDATRTPRA